MVSGMVSACDQYAIGVAATIEAIETVHPYKFPKPSKTRKEFPNKISEQLEPRKFELTMERISILK